MRHLPRCRVPLNPDPDDVTHLDDVELLRDFFAAGYALVFGDYSPVDERVLERRLWALMAEMRDRRRAA
jgi:hypothetical protein